MDLVKRNAEIVALVKARKMPMREIASRYRLSTSSISLIAGRNRCGAANFKVVPCMDDARVARGI